MTEIDTTNSATHLFTASTVKVSRFHKHLGYTLSELISVPTQATEGGALLLGSGSVNAPEVRSAPSLCECDLEHDFT